MKTIKVHKANPVGRQRRVPGVLIHAALILPENMPEERRDAVFVADGAKLASALWDTLPGGTLDAVLAALMARRACDLIVSLAGAAKP